MRKTHGFSIQQVFWLRKRILEMAVSLEFRVIGNWYSPMIAIVRLSHWPFLKSLILFCDSFLHLLFVSRPRQPLDLLSSNKINPYKHSLLYCGKINNFLDYFIFMENKWCNISNTPLWTGIYILSPWHLFYFL